MCDPGHPEAPTALLTCCPHMPSTATPSTAQVCAELSGAGFVPLLLGQLRSGSSLEPVLQQSSLALVLLFIQVGACGASDASPVCKLMQILCPIRHLMCATRHRLCPMIDVDVLLL
jgi:hypothetical protein